MTETVHSTEAVLLRFVALRATIALLLCACSQLPPPRDVAQPPHPLDPLTAAEIEVAVAVLRAEGKADEATRFPEVALREPAKDGAPGREASLVVLDRKANRSYEAVVDLTNRRLVAWRAIANGQPMLLMEEYEKAEAAVRADARWRQAMGRRGIQALGRVYLDVWAPGEQEQPGAAGARLARVLSNWRGTQKNPYGPPIEGVVAVVNLDTMQVIDVVDAGVVAIAQRNTDFYAPEVTGPARPALPPMRLSQPEGPGFSVRGHEVAWDKWRFRVAMHPREGLVLHAVGYEDQGRVRSILHRASISEMFVPYADPSATWAWRSAFDEGEYGLGRLAAPLEAGKGAPANSVFLPATFCDDEGKPYVAHNVVFLAERDGGILWTHYDATHGTAARRARELEVGFIATIGNYDYVCSWVFKQDGTLEFDTALSGSLLTKGVTSAQCEVCPADAKGTVEPAGEQRFGTLVDRNVLAPNHQHFICLRLDFDVDGVRNGVKEVNVRAEPAGEGNPRRNAFYAVPTFLAREREAARDPSPLEHRTWEVFNADRRSPIGHPAGYRIEPGASAVPFLHAGTRLRQLAGFADHAFRATRYHADEMSAAGRFPSQATDADGVAVWAADDESLTGEDVVVWYTIGVTHIPRPEEYPVMPVTHVGFKLVPVGFFTENPALDVPAAAGQ